MKNTFNIVNVTDENFGKKFYELIKSDSKQFTQKYIPKTSLFRYLLNYLTFEENGLQVKTIISENNYTCLNFLEDYANYYARCYTLYDKHCKRIHFFSKKIIESDFLQMLQNSEHDNWNEYVGCIVIKPLPKGIFGITYLKTYTKDNEEKKRYYKCLSKKTINLFGHDCAIETMPFKEQDGVVASCATTALWMAFQKTSELFNTKAPSLSEVTILAGDKNSNSGKIFPSKGLELYQVCKAINNNGLISEFRTDLTSKYFFKGLIYAYLKGDIPVLLGLRLPANDEYHLVTINGYKLDADKNETKYVSDEISRFYVHDDQIGPFSRLLIDDEISEITDDKGQKIKYDYTLTTSWWQKGKLHDWINNDNDFIKIPDSNKNAKSSFIQSTPACIIIPISPIIKVTYEDILEQQGIIEFVTGSFINIPNFDIKWDIFVIKSNEYKKWLIKKFGQKEQSHIKDILITSLPQYVWIIQAWIEDDLLFDFIYDTIELNKTGQPVAINVYNDTLERELKDKNKIDTQCSNGFFVEKYEKSLIRTMNELPYDFEEIKNWFQDIENWADVKKKRLEQLWYLSENIEYSKSLSNQLYDYCNKKRR
jgi:hypothetical protein